MAIFNSYVKLPEGSPISKKSDVVKKNLGESGTTLQENGQMSTTCTSEDGGLDGDGDGENGPREKTLPLKYPMNLNPMVMTNIAMENRWPIEIDDFPF